jgi:isoquinoline 1-oxidoreductase subunit beta
MQRGWYRPTQMARLKAAIGKDGALQALTIRTSGPSMVMEFRPGAVAEGGLDGSSVQDLSALRYQLQAYRLDYAMRHFKITAAPWRAVGATQNAFFLECFLDEVAESLKQDPLALRRQLLAHDPRALAVLNLAAEKANWGKPLPKGRARGIAYFESFGSLCAHVAEVSMQAGALRVHKVTVAMDCGRVVLPDAALAQMQGAVIQGLSVALHEEVTINNGQAEQTNFDTYRLLRIDEAPAIAVHFVESGAPLGGIGEPGLPPLAPAVANAASRLTGKRIRSLPIMKAMRT